METTKKIKLWAIILLIAVMFAGGLAWLTGGKTGLFKGSVDKQTATTPPTLKVNGQDKIITTLTPETIKITPKFIPGSAGGDFAGTGPNANDGQPNAQAGVKNTIDFIPNFKPQIFIPNFIPGGGKQPDQTPPPITQPQLKIEPTIPNVSDIAQGGTAEMLKLKFTAETSPITITNLTLTIAGTASQNDIASISILDEANNTIGSVTPSAANAATYAVNLNVFQVQLGTPRTVSIKTAVAENAQIDKTIKLVIAQPQKIATDPLSNISPITPISSNEFKIVSKTVKTLGVSLQANPSSGNVPLNDVTFTADISGTTTGTINYHFYCNRSDTGTNVTTPTDAQFLNDTSDPKTAAISCKYSSAGIYTAKVIAEQGGLSAEARATVTVNAVVGGQQQQQQQIVTDIKCSDPTFLYDPNAKVCIPPSSVKSAGADTGGTKKDSGTKKKSTKKKTVTNDSTQPVYTPPVQQPQYMYSAAPLTLDQSQKLVKIPEKSNTGPEVLVYFIAVGAANAAWWVRRKVRK